MTSTADRRDAGMKPGDIAWTALAAGVIAYELRAPHGELLSEAVDRYRARRPLVTHAAVIYVAGHLVRVWPARVDPLTRLAEWMRR